MESYLENVGVLFAHFYRAVALLQRRRVLMRFLRDGNSFSRLPGYFLSNVIAFLLWLELIVLQPDHISMAFKHTHTHTFLNTMFTKYTSMFW